MLQLCLIFTDEKTTEASNRILEGWIGDMAGGDKDALRRFYEQTRTAVYGFALSIVKNAQDAEDVLQDTFINLYDAASSYKARGKPMAWILTITRNLSLMRIRQRRRTSDLPLEDWDIASYDSVSMTREDSIILSAALRSISSEEFQIVILHAVSGFKHREIAQLIGLPLSTVLSKYNRALKKLKSQLTEDGQHE